MVGDTPYPFGPCAGKQLYLAYTRWCRANGVRFPRNSIQFLNRVGKMPGWFCGNDARYRIWDNTHYTGPKSNPLRFVVPDMQQLTLNKRGRRFYELSNSELRTFNKTDRFNSLSCRCPYAFSRYLDTLLQRPLLDQDHMPLSQDRISCRI